MLKKIIVGVVILSTTSLFSMNLSQLNSASKEDLIKINGIGEKKATLILKEKKNGKFKSFEDFSSRVKGIGTQTAQNVKNDVTKSTKKSLKKIKTKKKKLEKKK